MISTDFHVQRYFEYGALVKEALLHFRRFCRRKPIPYETDGACVRARGRACLRVCVHACFLPRPSYRRGPRTYITSQPQTHAPTPPHEWQSA